MKTIVFYIITLCASSTFLHSCGKDTENKEIYAKKVSVYGDPEEFVAGTSKNTKSFINETNLNKFQNYNISGLHIIHEHSDSIDISNTIYQGYYSVDKNDERTFTFKSSISNSISFRFSKDENNEFNLTSVRLSNQKKYASVKPLHYSISPDESVISILFVSNSLSNAKILISATFTKLISNTADKNSISNEVIKMDEKYVSLLGKGKVCSWKLPEDKKINITVCPSVMKELENLQKMSVYSSLYRTSPLDRAKAQVKKAILSWTSPFKAHEIEFDFQINFPETCLPFSDVNEHSIHWISSYLTKPDEKIMNTGITLAQFTETGVLFSSDIFILGSELNKYDQRESKSYRVADLKIDSASIAITHEVGHFLGLGHNHDEITSVMSYNGAETLDEYDKNSILNLYYNQVIKKEEIKTNEPEYKKNPLEYKPINNNPKFISSDKKTEN